MIIQLGFYKRRQGLSVAEFQHLWSEVYGPMYRQHPELTRHLRRYVQHRLSPIDQTPADQLPYDGFSEAWFASAADSAALCREPIYLEQIAPLASSFLDIERSSFVAYDSQVYQVGGPPEVSGWAGDVRTV